MRRSTRPEGGCAFAGSGHQGRNGKQTERKRERGGGGRVDAARTWHNVRVTHPTHHAPLAPLYLSLSLSFFGHTLPFDGWDRPQKINPCCTHALVSLRCNRVSRFIVHPVSGLLARCASSPLARTRESYVYIMILIEDNTRPPPSHRVGVGSSRLFVGFERTRPVTCAVVTRAPGLYLGVPFSWSL